MSMGKRKATVVALSVFLLFPFAVQAGEDSEAWMNGMEDRMRLLEDKLTASEATIEAQADLIRSQPGPDVAEGGALSEFLNGLVWGGHVTGSYVHNFNRPDAQEGAQTLGQFNRDHETFKLDAAKIELGKEAAEPGTAGFQLDLLWGENAGILGGYTESDGFASDNFSHVQEAYATYNWDGTLLKFGKFETLLGWEVIDSPGNYNISHGVLFTFAIPLTHTGVLASGNLNEQVGWALGLANGFNNVTDTNNDKGVLGQLSYEEGNLFTSLSAYYGADGDTGATAGASPRLLTDPETGGLASDGFSANNHDESLIIDFVASISPSDDTTLWLNADWGTQKDVQFDSPHTSTRSGHDSNWWGAAVGIHQQLSEKMDFALRGEYFVDDDGYRLLFANPAEGGDRDAKVYTLTGTLGLQLTENLKTRAELRYDKLNSKTGNFDRIFPQGSSSNLPSTGRLPNHDQWLALWEVSYNFSP